MQAHAIALPPLVTTWDDPGASGSECLALGVYEDTVWASWGADARRYNAGTDAWDDTGTNFTSAPVTKGTVFVPSIGALTGDPIFIVPLSSSFDYINGVTRTNVAKSCVSAAVMDNKLFILGADGSFQFTPDMTNWYGLCYIPDDSTPRKLNVYMTVGGEPSIHATTSAGVFVWDALAETFFPTQLQYPKHPDQGRSSAVWRADLYTAVGDGVHRYNRSTIVAQGLDRDDGLPIEYRGVIVDLEPSYNALYALMSGVTASVAQAEDVTRLDVGDDYMTASQGSAYSTLMKWNGFGWHYVYSTYGTAPTTAIVSDAGNDYAVWFACNKKMHKVPLTRTYMNLKDRINYNFASSGYFDTAQYDFGWQGQTKVLKLFEIDVDQASSTEKVLIQYRVDHEENPWVTLGEITSSGEHAFYFNRDSNAPPDSDDPTDFSGQAVDNVQFRFTLSRGSNTELTPIINWFTVAARKMLRPVRTFRLVTNLDITNGYTSQELRGILLEAIRTPSSCTFVYQNETLKVDLVALEFRTIEQGTKIFYIAKLNLIESNETIF